MAFLERMLDRLLGRLARSSLQAIFGRLLVRRLKAQGNLVGLIAALDNRNRLSMRVSAARALSEIDGEQAVGPLMAALGRTATRLNEAFAAAFGPLSPAIQTDLLSRVNLAVRVVFRPPSLPVESNIWRRWFVILALMVGSVAYHVTLLQAPKPRFLDTDDLASVQQGIAVMILAASAVGGGMFGRALLHWGLETWVVRRGKALYAVLFHPLQPTVTALQVDRAVRDLRRMDAWFDALVRALVEIGPPAVESLLVALKDRQWTMREQVARALGEIGDERAVEPLLEALHGPDLPVLMAVVERLQRIDTSAVEPLLTVLEDRMPYTRVIAAQAQQRVGDLRAADLVDSALKNEYWTMLIAASEALVTWGNPRTCDLLMAALKDKYWSMLYAMATALIKIDGGEAFESLSSALHDGDVVLRRVAAETLGQWGDARAIEPLEAALGDEEEAVRTTAQMALDRMGA